MCGFVGLIYSNNNIKSDINSIVNMNNAINHRGPDDDGIVLFSFKNKKFREINQSNLQEIPNIFEGAIGFKRLSIIDLSRNGHQPMIDKENNIILTLNGEIYNAFDYRDFLISKGFKFRSRTDTEILLYMYEFFGLEGMLERINGMFALCIIDLNKNSIILARDRMGIKPLYYYKNDNVFMFSSEVKSFLFNKNFKPELEESNIDENIKFGYISGTETLLKNVYCVEPGQYMVIANNSIKKHFYWDIYNENKSNEIGLKQATELIENEIQKSLRLRLMSDVKIGCQLSGGIDSSLVTLITANNLKDYDLNTISVLFDDEKYSEEKWIDKVSNLSNVINHKYTLTKDYFTEKFKAATWHFDFPIAIPNCIGIYLLAEKAKKYFTVFLSGEGADEMFGGYSRFHGGKILDNKLYASILKNTPYLNKYLNSWYVSSYGNEDFNATDWFITTTTHLSMKTLKRMKKDIDLQKSMSKRRKIFDEGKGDFIKKAQRYELKTWLVDLLMRQDKMTMANSVENRVPFLDHNLVNISRKLPTKFLARSLIRTTKNTKIILKKIAEKHFGKDFAYRPKSGFQLPLKNFYSYNIFKSWIFDSIIPGIKTRGLFNHQLIPENFNNLSSLKYEQIQMLWTLISFEVWAQLFLDKN